MVYAVGRGTTELASVTPRHAMGDSDGDGDVDVDDLVAFRLAFGPPPVFSGIVSVPEPGTIGLALLLMAGLWVWCGRPQGRRQLVG